MSGQSKIIAAQIKHAMYTQMNQFLLSLTGLFEYVFGRPTLAEC